MEQDKLQGKKRHSCDKCLCKFSRESDLKRHIRDHSGQHKCEVCAKTFTSLKSLKRHEDATHKEDSKTLSCKTCNKGFAQPYRLREHELSHQPKSFKCESCLLELSTKSNLRRHLRIKHNVTPIADVSKS